VSFTSAEQAQRWLDAEIPAWDFDRLRAAAAAEWHRALGAVALDGAPPDEARKLYTALWHAMVQPRDRTGDMPGFDPAELLWDDHYTLWDTWKTLFPLMAILQPETVRDNIRSFITRHNKNADGYVAEAFIQGREFKVGQGGNETDNVIADAFAKKIPGVDWAQAYAVMKHHAEHGRTANYREHGWVASDEQADYSWRLKSGSGTLAFAYNDYNIAQVAKGLGKTADYERYLARSQNWRNVWDDSLEVEGFRGFVHSRLLDGTFLSPTATAGQNPGRREREGYNRDFYEGSWWEYSNDVPHDLPGLIEKMGGREACLRRLIHAFRRDYIDFGNEPSFMTPWLFDQLQRPYLASFWADRLRRQFTDRDLPGDDDDGAMSSLYVFLTAGFFPIAGQDVYYLHGARVPKLAFHLTNGKIFTVVAENVGPENIFVQSATLNGRPLDTPAIHHTDIVAGGTLNFVMGAQPSAWGTGGEFDPAAAARELAPVVVQKPGE
jgi:predicted alpha-1,2-mannosidase